MMILAQDRQTDRQRNSVYHAKAISTGGLNKSARN